jgi:hypothetical protein
MPFFFLCVLFISAISATTLTSARDVPAVTLVRLPDGGIQPQALTDEHGVAHVVYFQGTPGAGDLMYARHDGAAFSAPIRVNSIPGSAIASGSVRGARVALGRGGRVHVSWNGSIRVGDEGSKRIPMWYARLDSGARAFEPQRDVSVVTEHIDGGGGVAADRAGNVWVAWHAQGKEPGEAHRTIYIARSRDDGTTFGAAQPLPLATGVCGCCGMQAFSSQMGRIDLLYRAATDGIHRDAISATTSDADHPDVFTMRLPEGRWELRQCPMSTFAFGADREGGLTAAWQTGAQIYMMGIAGRGPTMIKRPIAMTGSGTNRKHPSAAINAAGIHLVAWTEGTAWNRGGTVAWELFGTDGKPLAARADAGVVPTWGLVAAAARRDGSFVIFH